MPPMGCRLTGASCERCNRCILSLPPFCGARGPSRSASTATRYVTVVMLPHVDGVLPLNMAPTSTETRCQTRELFPTPLQGRPLPSRSSPLLLLLLVPLFFPLLLLFSLSLGRCGLHRPELCEAPRSPREVKAVPLVQSLGQWHDAEGISSFRNAKPSSQPVLLPNCTHHETARRRHCAPVDKTAQRYGADLV